MPINAGQFYQVLQERGVEFFTGVPDSLLKDFCAYIDETLPAEKHVIAANEGNAMAIASGHYLNTGNIPLVYLQNSGLGNTINPLLSLCDPEIYAIPIVMLIGWRGEPGVKDAIQHIKDGRIQNELLKALEVPYTVIGPEDDYTAHIESIIEQAVKECRPVAIIIRKGTFEPYVAASQEQSAKLLTREEAIESIIECFSDEEATFISTTGKASRELYEVRERLGQAHQNDFLNVGAMGHCSSIALGSAMADPSKPVVCIDGDGAMIMHMGALAVIGTQKPKNLVHVVINNGAHESVGGQPTAGLHIDICGIAKACGYASVHRTERAEDIAQAIQQIKSGTGPALLEVRIKKGSRKDLGRPQTDLRKDKAAFMEVA